MKDEQNRSRRDFLRTFAITGAGLTLAGPTAARAFGPRGEAPRGQESRDAAPAGKVPRKKLGQTGQDVPILLAGCAQKFDPKYDKILHRAFKEGVDYLDTALVYADGMSHKTIAPFIEQVGRENLWITSKGPSSNATMDSYARDLDTCLEQLGTDHLDLYFMHFVDDPKYLDPEYIQMGDRLRKSGKTRFFGFSCHGDRMVECMEKAARAGGIDAIMFRYSFSRYGDLELNRAMDACKKAGIGLIAMKTQNSVPDDQRHVKEFQSKNFTLPQAKLKAVWADERIDAAVSHMDNTKKLAENVAAAKSPMQLTMKEFQQLQRIATASAGYACQGCSHICESRVDGQVKVARPLRYLMYSECYGETERARRLYARLRPEERALDSVDLGAATAACPQGIDIAARLRIARQTLEARA
jgi:predicted aldo/keto reductase-like oxidoreductase